MDWLIDTNILIDHLRGVPRATAFLRKARKQQTLWVSVITVAEIHAGRRMKQSKERAAVVRFLKLFRVVYLDGAIAVKGGEIVRDHSTALPDALIAATAISKGLKLATRNTRRFQGISDLILESPY
ncbi:MAG: type II toxin-antitoxin system VapC family toxin [Blastocatellia bacterium]